MDNRGWLEEGDIIEIVPGNDVGAMVPRHFLYSNSKGDFSLTRGLVKVAGEFLHLAGRYVVYKTTYDGGGRAHNDVYSDGHHVWCERLSDRSVKLDFYQSGDSGPQIRSVKVVGRATRIWVEDEDVQDGDK